MIIVLFVIHVLIALALIGVIMLQKSEGGALGMGGGGGMSGFMTGRSTANLLTRTTAILALGFFLTSIVLVKLSNYAGPAPSIIDQGPMPGSPLIPGPATTPAPIIPAAPATPPGPSAPLAK
jgi:preprotein translocase subunit SecG